MPGLEDYITSFTHPFPVQFRAIVPSVGIVAWDGQCQKQVALLSQRGRTMFRVCNQLQQYNTWSATSASDLPLHTLFCSHVFVVVVHAAGCDKYRFTDASPQVHGGLSQLLFTGPAHHPSIASYIADDRDMCLPHMHSTPLPVRGGSLSEYCHDV